MTYPASPQATAQEYDDGAEPICDADGFDLALYPGSGAFLDADFEPQNGSGK